VIVTWPLPARTPLVIPVPEGENPEPPPPPPAMAPLKNPADRLREVAANIDGGLVRAMATHAEGRRRRARCGGCRLRRARLQSLRRGSGGWSNVCAPGGGTARRRGGVGQPRPGMDRPMRRSPRPRLLGWITRTVSRPASARSRRWQRGAWRISRSPSSCSSQSGPCTPTCDRHTRSSASRAAATSLWSSEPIRRRANSFSRPSALNPLHNARTECRARATVNQRRSARTCVGAPQSSRRARYRRAS
jgi:hypothetical protein